MPTIMFKVGNTDYSANVIDNSSGYKVQTDPVFTAWTDANGREHRSVYREKTEGTFTLFFKTIEDYEEFCLTMEANRANDTSYPCTVYDNNRNVEVVSDFFIKFTPVRHRTDDFNDYIAAISVTIEEC